MALIKALFRVYVFVCWYKLIYDATTRIMKEIIYMLNRLTVNKIFFVAIEIWQ